MKTVADVMTREVISIDADRTVSEAVALMKRRNISSLLVDRDSSVDAFGIVTENDVISKIVALGRDPKAAKVREIMSKPIVTIPPECSLKDCAHLMSQRDVRRLTVFDGRRVIGIVSSSDIFDVTE
jgi:CBS domain-containing protein